MLDAGSDRTLDQGARFDSVVQVVAEWICDRFGNDNRASEVDNRIDIALADHSPHEIVVCDIADYKFSLRRDGPFEAR